MKLSRIIIFTIFAVLAMANIDLFGGYSFETCKEICRGFEGMSYSNCLNKCLKTHDRTSSGRRNSIRKKMQDCEQICKAYEGLDNVRCMRMCLEKHPGTVNTNKSKPNRFIRSKNSVCEKRCGMLTGVNKYNCIKRCERNEKFNK